jgi:GNAT superfamily N-acetyltransferase
VSDAVDERLARHLRARLGAWPPAHGAVEVSGDPQREREHGGRWWMPALAVASPEGAVLSVPPAAAERLRHRRLDLESDDLWREVAALTGEPDAVRGTGVFRWTDRPVPAPELGVWLDPADPRVPPWLGVFDGDVLVALDEGGAYLGGAGRKRHDPRGHEISVGVEPGARGRGLARALVSRLARRILDEGAIPTYIHDPQNGASCRVAEAAGFPDRGWRAMALWTAGGTG